MRTFFKKRLEGETRDDCYFTYSRYHSNKPGMPWWRSLWTFSFFPTARKGFLVYFNLLPERMISMIGIRFANIKPDFRSYDQSADQSSGK